MTSWDIVLFSQDNSCEYLPSSWAVDEQKNLYLWPKKLSQREIRNLRDNCVTPSSNVEYDEWSGTCKATVYNIAEARKLAQKATYTSNLSSSEGDEEHNSESNQVGSETPDEIFFEKENSHSGTPKIIRLDGSGSRSGPSACKLRTPVNSLNSNSTSQVLKNSFERSHSTPLKNEDNDEMIKEMKKITKAIAGTKYDIMEIKKDINEMKIRLDILNENSMKKNLPNFTKFNLPLKTQGEMDELEEKINDASKDDFKDLVDILSHVGGLTPKKNVLFIMEKLMNRELSLEHSAHGKKQKKNFSSLNLYKVVLEAVKVHFHATTDLEITQYIGVALATAGDRDGGRSNRGQADNDHNRHPTLE